MPSITVQFHTLIRNALDTESIKVDADNVGAAIKQVDAKFGQQIRNIYKLGKGIELYEFCMLLLNGLAVDMKEIDRTALKAGDTLHVLPPAAGG